MHTWTTCMHTYNDMHINANMHMMTFINTYMHTYTYSGTFGPSNIIHASIHTCKWCFS